jgi:hypothetical protein
MFLGHIAIATAMHTIYCDEHSFRPWSDQLFLLETITLARTHGTPTGRNGDTKTLYVDSRAWDVFKQAAKSRKMGAGELLAELVHLLILPRNEWPP